MNHYRWLNIPPIGDLFIEQILITFDVPELFVCKDGNGDRFLVLYEDNENYQYLLVEVDCYSLLELLQRHVSIDWVFRNSINGNAYRLVYDKEKDALRLEPIEARLLSQEELPDKGTYLAFQGTSVYKYRDKIEKEYRDKLLSTEQNESESIYDKYKIAVGYVKGLPKQRPRVKQSSMYKLSWKATYPIMSKMSLQESAFDGEKSSSIFKSCFNKIRVPTKSRVSGE